MGGEVIVALFRKRIDSKTHKRLKRKVKVCFKTHKRLKQTLLGSKHTKG